jgi:hypothetical protein
MHTFIFKYKSEPCTLHQNQFNKIPKQLPIYGTDKKASCIQKYAMVLDDKRGGTSCKETTCIFLSFFFFFFE